MEALFKRKLKFSNVKAKQTSILQMNKDRKTKKKMRGKVSISLINCKE